MLRDLHADYGAEFETRGGRTVVAQYGRPARTHLAVRNGVGVIEMGYGVVVVDGPDAVEYVDDAVSAHLPATDGEGRYALVLDPRGRIETELSVYNAGERLLCVTPPDRAEPLAEQWRETAVARDVSVRDASTEFAVFGIHGPDATDSVSTLLAGASPPDRPLTFVRGSIHDAGVVVVSAEDPTGETGYEVVVAAADAESVFDSLLTRSTPTTPVGYHTWDTLTLEAGTPLFETELAGHLPTVAGRSDALDFDNDRYVGREVVARVATRGPPRRRLVGLTVDADGAVPGAGASVVDRESGAAVGGVTRAVATPSCSQPVGFAYVDADALDASGGAGVDLAVRTDGATVDATVAALPFVEGSGRSGRIPDYDSDLVSD
jgi:aminomethyltransferase